MQTDEMIRLLDELKSIKESVTKLYEAAIKKPKNPTESDQLNELFTALAKAQAEIEIAGKKEINPFLKSKYADLAELVKVSRPALTKNGLAVIQQIVTTEEGLTLLYTILSHTSGQWIKTMMRILPLKNDIQSFGSCVTYNRRYAYAALINIAAENEDDDGEAAVHLDRQVMSKGTALNTKYNPKDQSYETITKEQREELEYELSNPDHADIAEMILDGFKIRSIADMPKGKFMAAITRVREIKQVREGK